MTLIKKLFTFLAFVIFISLMSAQEGFKHYVFKGKIDKYPVTLYLKEETTGCGPKIYNGMYKYDNLSKWLYLEISDNEANRLVMVEGGITGILSLQKNGETLKGFWISPEGNKKLNVNLKELPVTNKSLESYQNTFEDLNYEWNDC